MFLQLGHLRFELKLERPDILPCIFLSKMKSTYQFNTSLNLTVIMFTDPTRAWN